MTWLTRALLLFLLVMFVLRAFWRLVAGIIEGASLPGPGGPPDRGVRMVRDPVCGTFVVPSRALTAGQGDRTLYFCSERCRSRYDAKTEN